MPSRQNCEKKKRSGNRSAVPRTLQIFPAASLTASLKEFFLSFISVSWLKSIISSSANQFTLLSRSPAASRNGNVSEGSGESRLLRSGTATNTEHKLCPSAFVLAIHLLYCVSSRLYNSDTTNSPQWLHTLTHTFFPLTVMAVAASVYYSGWSCLAGIQFNIQIHNQIRRRGGKEMLRARWSSAVSVPPFLSRHPSSPLSSRLSLGIQCKFSTPTLWSVPLDGLLSPHSSSESPRLSAGVPCCAPIPFLAGDCTGNID